MSLFLNQQVPCPACAEPVDFDVNYSINADRRPDFRLALLDGSFQVETCKHCGQRFRLEPEMTYLDVARRQWILVRPGPQRQKWRQLEADARSTYDIAYGSHAPDIAQRIGSTLQPRVAFGWAALREKLVCADAELDDIVLELVKLTLLRVLPQMPLADDSELRLARVHDATLELVWIRLADEAAMESMTVPRVVYDEVAAALQEWQALHAEISAGPYVDFTRLLWDDEGPDEASPTESTAVH